MELGEMTKDAEKVADMVIIKKGHEEIIKQVQNVWNKLTKTKGKMVVMAAEYENSAKKDEKSKFDRDLSKFSDFLDYCFLDVKLEYVNNLLIKNGFTVICKKTDVDINMTESKQEVYERVYSSKPPKTKTELFKKLKETMITFVSQKSDQAENISEKSKDAVERHGILGDAFGLLVSYLSLIHI